MEREIANADDWNPETISDRRERLTEWALHRWRVPEDIADEVPAVPADQEDVTEPELEISDAWA